MGMGVGAGGMAFASEQMRRVQRQLDTFMHKRAAARSARFEANRRYGEGLYKPPDYHVDFPCFWLCQDCGYFCESEVKACPACGRTAVFHLADDVAAQRFRMAEEFGRHRCPNSVKLVLAVIVAAAAVAVMAGLGWSIWAILIAGALSIPAHALLLRPASVLFLRIFPPPPTRWHLPVAGSGPKPGSTTGVAGRVEPLGDKLASPFTGTECVAYQLVVVFDTAGDARPPVWVLEEIEGVPFEVDRVKVDGDKVLVAKPLRPVDPAEVETESRDLRRFLRARGLFDYEGEYELFESCVAPGDEVQVKIDGNTGIATVG